MVVKKLWWCGSDRVRGDENRRGRRMEEGEDEGLTGRGTSCKKLIGGFNGGGGSASTLASSHDTTTTSLATTLEQTEASRREERRSRIA